MMKEPQAGRTGKRLAILTLICFAAPSAPVVPALAEPEFAEPAELDPVVVTATRTPRPVSEIGSSITVITREDLDRRQTRQVSDVLREVPSVSVSESGGVGQLTQIRMRGAEANHTLVLIDGVEANDPSLGAEFDFAHILADDVERIEILRGPQSMLYGSEAAAGIVNIITKRGEGPPSVSATAEGGSFATGRANVRVDGGQERFDYALSATGYRTDGVSIAKEPPGETKPDGYRNITTSGKFRVSPFDNLDLDFLGRLTRFESESDAFAPSTVLEDTLAAVEADRESDGRQRFAKVEATLELLDERWEQTVGLGYTDHRRDFFEDGAKRSRFEGDKRRLSYQSNLYLVTPGVAWADHTLTFAFENETEGVDVDTAFSTVDDDFSTQGFVGQYQLALFDRVFLSGGVRYDDNDLFQDAATYRVTAAYRHLETGTKLKGSLGTGVKNPTVFELFGFSDSFEPNPDLKPEGSIGWDAGVEQSLLNDHLRLDATYFEQRIDNLIQRQGLTAVNLPGDSRARGVELSASAQPLAQLDVSASYTFTDTRDADGKRLVRRPKHVGSLNGNYRFLDDRANVNLSVVLNGRQRDFRFDETFQRSMVTLSSFTLVNVAGSYRLHDNARVFARLENALDSDREEVFTFNAPGRAAFAGINLTF